MKSYQIQVVHILQAIDRIEQYIAGMTEQEFLENFLV